MVVEANRLDVLHRPVGLGFDEARRLDHERAAGHRDPGMRERRGVDEHQLLAGHREQAERRPDVPGTQPARVVVARQSAPTGRELVVDSSVHDLGGPIRAADVVVRPWRFHVRFVVEALEAVQLVALRDVGSVGRHAELLDRLRPESEEPVEQLDEARLAARQFDPLRHVVGEAERVVPLPALVERGVDEESGLGIEGVDPPGRQRVELIGERSVADVAGDLCRAVVGEREVERVRDRMGNASFEELLAVVAPQIGVHVHERPVPVDALEIECADVGEERVRKRAALPREPVGAPRHPVADREVALLLADDEQCVCEFDRTVGRQQRDQWQLGAVDVPHRCDVEHERPRHRPERALVGCEARLDQRVVERSREDRAALARCGLDADGVEPVRPVGTGRRTAPLEAASAGAAVGVEVATGLLDATQREPEPQLDCLAGLGRAEQDQTERSQRGRTDRVELQLCATWHQPLVVPEHLTPRGGVALDVHRQRRPFDDDLAFGDTGLERGQMRPGRHGTTVLNRKATEREVDHQPGIPLSWKRVAVHRRFRTDRQLGPDAVLQRRRVVARLGCFVIQRPHRAEVVERVHHRGDAEVVVVLADRAGARLLEVRETRRNETLVQHRRDTFGRELVDPVPGRVGAGVGACGDHPERRRRAGVGVADLRLRPPPRGGQTHWRCELGDVGPDEGIDRFDHRPPRSAASSNSMRSPYGTDVPRSFRRCEHVRESTGERPERPETIGWRRMSRQPHDDVTPWWRDAVVYQIYPRSFADSNGDGVGDLAGITGKLDYLADLGVDALWLSPIFTSPMRDFGYDVADYCGIDPVFGTDADFDDLIDGVHRRGMRLLLDWVPNHSSSDHPWFVESRSSRDSPKRDWYVWKDRRPDGSPPNNWQAMFNQVPAWTHDDATDQSYLHLFLAEQPDLNWANPDVESAMHDTLRYWLDRGVDGFRADVVNLIGKGTDVDDLPDPLWKSPLLAIDRPFGHELLRRIRRLLDGI